MDKARQNDERDAVLAEDKTGARLGEGRRTKEDEGPRKNKNKRNTGRGACTAIDEEADTKARKVRERWTGGFGVTKRDGKNER